MKLVVCCQEDWGAHASRVLVCASRENPLWLAQDETIRMKNLLLWQDLHLPGLRRGRRRLHPGRARSPRIAAAPPSTTPARCQSARCLREVLECAGAPALSLWLTRFETRSIGGGIAPAHPPSAFNAPPGIHHRTRLVRPKAARQRTHSKTLARPCHSLAESKSCCDRQLHLIS